MKIIDAHMHTTFGADGSPENKPFSIEDFRQELKLNNVVKAISITSSEKFRDPTPMKLELALRQKHELDSLEIVVGLNPVKCGKKEILLTEKALSERTAIGMKIYPGYTHYYPTDEIYKPFYKLAEKYKAPVIIHSGDVWMSPSIQLSPPKLKYSHPFIIDELAVDNPGVNFVIAHLGNPWIRDAAEIIYKNQNVYTDISGLVIGDVKKMNIDYLKLDMDFVFNFSCAFNKIIYGSDWPLVKMKDYIEIIKKVVPKQHWEKVFYSNAKQLFKI